MQEISLDRQVAPEQLVQLLEKAGVPQSSFSEGQTIFEEGSRGEQAFFLAAGSVKILKKGQGGKQKLLDILQSGVIFGEMALLDEPTRSAGAVGNSSGSLYTIDRAMMGKLTSSIPDFSFWLLRTFSHRLRTLNQKVAQMEKLQEMNTKIIMMQQKERVRIARDINEGPAQMFADYVMRCEIIGTAAKMKPDQVPRELADFKEALKNGMTKLNNLAVVLSPTDVKEAGFSEVLYYMATNMEREGAYKVIFKCDTIKADELDPSQQNTLFLILQDGLRNLADARNAQTANVTITKLPGRIKMTIADDGPGYDFNKVKQGFYKREVENFSLMRDRAMLVGGNMTIHTAPGQGTRLEIDMPMKTPGGD